MSYRARSFAQGFLVTALIATLAALALPSCSSAAPFVASGETLKFAGNQFVETAALMDQGLKAGTVTVEQYRAWKAFGEKFQIAYPPAVQLWKSSRVVNDAVLDKQVAGIITSLVTELAAFYVVGSRAVAQAAEQALQPAPDGGK